MRQRAVNLAEVWLILLMTFIGASLGTILIQLVDSAIIKKVLPFLILAIGLYFLFSPTLGNEDRQNAFPT